MVWFMPERMNAGVAPPRGLPVRPSKGQAYSCGRLLIFGNEPTRAFAGGNSAHKSDNISDVAARMGCRECYREFICRLTWSIAISMAISKGRLEWAVLASRKPP